MSKKYIMQDGKKVYLEDEAIKEELSESETEAKEIDNVAKELETKLGLKDLRAKMDKLDELVAKDAKKTPALKRKSKIVTLDELMQKDIEQLSTREGLAVFLRAAMIGDTAKVKALSEGTAADGGNLFLDEFRAELIRDVANIAVMRPLVRVVPMSKDVMKIPTMTSKPKVYWTAENTAKTTSTAAFGQATLTAFKMAAILYASDELIEDSQEIDVVSLIIDLFAEGIAIEEDYALTAGNGTTQPQGITQATLGSVAMSGTLDFDDVIDLEFLLPAKYSKDARFMGNRRNIKKLRQLKDSNNRYLWMDNPAPGQPSTFHGYPVVENNDISDTELYFGDFKKAYWLGDRKSMTIKITQDSETAFTKDQTAIRVVSRIAGTTVLADALKKLTGI